MSARNGMYDHHQHQVCGDDDDDDEDRMFLHQHQRKLAQGQRIFGGGTEGSGSEHFRW